MNILNAIGNTPLVELSNMNKNPNVRIMMKLEGSNPGGSIKDRPAYYMIRKAIKSGELTKDKTILEPTSGNTGIALAMIGSVMGFKVKLVMPKCVSMERRRVLEAYGAEIVLTPGCEKTDGAIKKAHELIRSEPDKYYMPNQFENPNNYLAHYETTGPEIWGQTKGNVDAVVIGIGTSGTLMGISKYIKEQNPKVKIIGIEPPLGHAIQGLKNMNEAIVPKIYDSDAMDEKITIDDDTAYETARQLALKDGLFVGMSSGCAVAGALKIAEKMGRNKQAGTIVTLLPDRGDRYLSTNLFRSFCAKCPP